MSIICEKCGRQNCRNNDSCIGCGVSPLNGSVMDQNTKIALDFLKKRKIIEGWETSLTKYSGGYWDGKQVDFVKLMAELLTENKNK